MSRLRPETFVWPGGGEADRAPAGLRAVVVGGGIAGACAATLMAERGVQVTMLEREAHLGGRAGAWTESLPDGEPFEMERGFHGFFRQYYNLRAWLRRFDPDLSILTPLPDYPVLGPGGRVQTFKDLPKTPPFQVAALTRRTPFLTARDLVRVNKRAALAMLTFDPHRTYERFDRVSARSYLDSLSFPEKARRMLFDVFSHSFFNPESEMSAAELLMMFHFYFTGNPEGLVFDVVNRPLSTAIWHPFARWLARRGATVKTCTAARRVERTIRGYRVHHDGGATDAELVVLAVTVPALQRLVDESPDLDDARFREGIRSLTLTRPFVVWRLWLDGPVRPDRPAFAGTAGVGLLDNISVFDKLEDESAAWARRTGGSVVELHAYAVPAGMDEAALRADLLGGLHAFYPETRGAGVLHERYLLRGDCPGFPPGTHGLRPTVETPYEGLALCGDFVRTPVPCALMERAATSGFLAANRLLASYGVRPEPVRSVPRRGVFAPLFSRRRRHA